MEFLSAHILGVNSFTDLSQILPCHPASESEEKQFLLFQSTKKHYWMAKSSQREIYLKTDKQHLYMNYSHKLCFSKSCFWSAFERRKYSSSFFLLVGFYYGWYVWAKIFRTQKMVLSNPVVYLWQWQNMILLREMTQTLGFSVIHFHHTPQSTGRVSN